MANLYDVAKRAGVSKTLVSRVVNSQPGVSQKSKEKILEAMEELHYVPNGIARSLVLQKTSIIGVVMDSLTEPYFFPLIKGIEQEITQSDYRVIFCSAGGNPALKEQYLDFFSSGRTDGVILYGSRLQDTPVIQNRMRSGFPMVIVENEPEGLELNNIVIDNVYGARLVTEHLIASGCRKILHVTGSLNVKASLDRKKGYALAMQNAGLQAGMEILDCNAFGVDTGYEAIRSYSKSHTEMPDAIFFGADNTAFGGLLALRELGIGIPEQIKVAGFDDDNPNFYNLPEAVIPLTTIQQPLYEAGSKAVSVLLSQIREPDSLKQKVLLYPKLLIRESTDPGRCPDPSAF